MAFGECNESKEPTLIEIAQQYERRLEFLEKQNKRLQKQNIELKEKLDEVVDRHTRI